MSPETEHLQNAIREAVERSQTEGDFFGFICGIAKIEEPEFTELLSQVDTEE